MRDKTLAIVGAAHVHLPDHVRVAGEAGFAIGAVFDRNAARAERWAGETGARAIADRAAITPDEIAGAIVCSETAHHEADIAFLLEAGIPVFTDKPLAGDAAAARRIAEAAARTGTLLHTGFFMRTNPPLAELRDRVRGGELGDVVEVRGRFAHDGAYADWLDLSGWMTTPDLACYGGFADEGVHVIDLLMWMAGPVAGGAARLGNARGFPVDDHGAAALSFKSGATGAVQAGWTDRTMRLEIELIGTEAGATVGDGKVEITGRGEDAPRWSASLSPLDAGQGLVPFLAALEGRPADALVTPDEAAAVNAVLDLLYDRAA
ncbi:MAG: Gfo/Idh/MocA family oxidoreductase [Roseitalea porphyridii]|jgi:1,5-anhydro-D-fructose reductase (1,5-anhydro-D-mannitol-forming)|uniref:Gfo/Idh/MocA family protein n=1 Tax=Roseitalea porphyridii TaxID=1852022 RepID=UPI0032EE5636